MSVDLEVMERRLAAMEAAVAKIQSTLGMNAATPNWIEQVAGTVKDTEVLEEMMKYAREYRHVDDPREEAEEPAA